jgi:hypothetical protein
VPGQAPAAPPDDVLTNAVPGDIMALVREDHQRAIPAIARDPSRSTRLEDAVRKLQTHHQLLLGDSRTIDSLPDTSVHLSNFTEILDQPDSGRSMELGSEVVEQDRGCRFEGVQIGPPAMAAQLVLEIAPDPLNQIQFGRIRR